MREKRRSVPPLPEEKKKHKKTRAGERESGGDPIQVEGVTRRGITPRAEETLFSHSGGAAVRLSVRAQQAKNTKSPPKHWEGGREREGERSEGAGTGGRTRAVIGPSGLPELGRPDLLEWRYRKVPPHLGGSSCHRPVSSPVFSSYTCVQCKVVHDVIETRNGNYRLGLTFRTFFKKCVNEQGLFFQAMK